MINFDYLLLEAFSTNLLEKDDTKETIKNYLKNLKTYKMYLKKLEKKRKLYEDSSGHNWKHDSK